MSRHLAAATVRVSASALVCAAVLALAGCADGLPPMDGARAFARVQRQVAFGPRIPGTAGHDSAAAWIDAELTRLGGRVERQQFTDSTLGAPLPLVNLIGRFGPDGGKRIALIAHWDSRPWADADPDTALHHRPVPGANDGGSGVAVLLEVAEALHRKPPPCAVELAFVDGEDLGTSTHMDGFCRGAREYARRMVQRRAPRVTAGFVFDMVGDRDLDIHPDQRSATEVSNLVDMVDEAARATHAPHFHPDARWQIFDDHIPLLDVGIPTVDIIDFDYPAWHTVRDLPDQVSPASLAEVSGVAEWLVYRSALAKP